MKLRVGIEAMGVAVPRRFISIEDLAERRGVDPAKYTHGLGAREMAIAEPGEDTVALAALAAQRALAAAGNRELGMLVVGTETGVDHSKPVASFVHGLLELPRTMRVFDTQHACYGGTAGVMAAVEWIASGAAGGRAALVVCSDVARYGLHTAGEPTQGAGAVAMVIAQDPAMLELDVGISGAASSHVHDFWRPLGQREAQVDGHYSMRCYTDALATAYRGWKQRAIARELVLGDGIASEQLARICYHVPFCKMAKKAHVALRALDFAELGRTDTDDAAAASFAAQVEPSLAACSRVGNIYTGSLYLALLSALDASASSLVGKRLGLFSYGSGCTSEFFSGVVGARAAELSARAELASVLAARDRISIDEYERIMGLTAPLGQPASFRFTGVEAHRREYARD
ncbi:MAG TPA: hydroxymethylglutaryl-CoA synthase [Kofleriaceae bacterium]